jgi:hypothetical protein
VPTNDESKQLASLLKKNYTLDSLPDFDFDPKGDLGVILRLNGAGCRYLIHDEGSVSKGVEVLSAVSDHLNCLMFRLLENPELCTRDKVRRRGSGAPTSAMTRGASP